MKMLIAIMLVLLVPLPTFAQVAVDKGEKAPFGGVLLTNEQAAKILAENKAQKELCEANIKYEKEKVVSVCKLEKKNLDIIVNTQKVKYDEMTKIKDIETKRLYEELEESSGDTGAYWVSGGLVVGGIVGVVTP